MISKVIISSFILYFISVLNACQIEKTDNSSANLPDLDSLKTLIYTAHYVDSILQYEWISCRMQLNYSNNIEEEIFLASATHANELFIKNDSIQLQMINGEWEDKDNQSDNFKTQASLWQYYLLAPYKLSESDKIWSIDTFHVLQEEEWLCAHYHHSKNPNDIYYVFTDPKHHIIRAIGLDSKENGNDFIILYESYTMESSGLFPNRWLLYSWNMIEGLKGKLGEVELYSYQLSDYEKVLELSAEF